MMFSSKVAYSLYVGIRGSHGSEMPESNSTGFYDILQARSQKLVNNPTRNHLLFLAAAGVLVVFLNGND